MRVFPQPRLPPIYRNQPSLRRDSTFEIDTFGSPPRMTTGDYFPDNRNRMAILYNFSASLP